jgi:hypothetical protein
MAPSTRHETFQIDPKFIQEIYTFFVNKYARNAANFSIQELVEDLKNRLICKAAALVQYDHVRDKVAILYSSTGNKNLLKDVANRLSTIEKIHELIYDERFSGDTIVLKDLGEFEDPLPPSGDDSDDSEILSISKKPSMHWEIVLLPMPRLSECEKFTTFDQLFMLVDTVALTPRIDNQPEHESQRILISEILFDWWVRALAPTFRRPHDGTNTEETKKEDTRFRNLWKTRRYIVSPFVLIEEGLRAKEDIRRAGRGKVFYFSGEPEKNGEFEWEKYTPLRPGRDSVEDARDDTKMLVYWCRWVDAHSDLEREQIASFPKQGRQTAIKMPVSKWVRVQRHHIREIDGQMELLRKKTADIFLAGGTRNDSTLSIQRNSLLLFSLNRWLAPDGWLRNNLGNEAISDIGFCRILHSVAVMVHYLLGEQYLSEDFNHRLRQLMAQYGHDDLEIPARIDLSAHLQQAARGEPELHALKPYYRDHFFHVLEVCLLGHLLLETRLPDGRHLWQLVAEHLGLQNDNEKPVLRLWYLAGLLHDIGYAVDAIDSTGKLLDFFHLSKPLESLRDSISEATKKLSEALNLEDFNIPKDSNIVKDEDLGKDHGLISAMHLKALLASIAGDDPALVPKEYDPAVQAIAMHNLRRYEPKISFQAAPLAFLLALCDQLQEWRRPKFSIATSPSALLSMLSGGTGDAGDSEGDFKKMRINLEAQKGDSGDISLQFGTGKAGQPCLHFTLEYTGKINRNSGVFHTWLDATLNFQRLDFTGLPADFDILVTFVTPLYDNQGQSVPQRQMQRLWDAAHDTHMPFLAKWFPNRKGSIESRDGITMDGLTNGGVSYLVNGDYEELTLNLRALAGGVIMTKGMDAFHERLKGWKHYNDDQDFPGENFPKSPD